MASGQSVMLVRCVGVRARVSVHEYLCQCAELNGVVSVCTLKHH